ncbi:hypothetical protein BJQ97_03339 [Geobacillus sp. TFV-3]|nr:hypothetical protein BJQ97_03339 [Geobacillus sp. TFV-3]
MPLLFFCVAGFVWKGGDGLLALRRKASLSNVCFPPSKKFQGLRIFIVS